MATETTINGHQYRIGRLNTFQQLHLSLKISKPLIAAVPAWAAMGEESLQGGDVVKLLVPVADELANMSDQNVEYIMNVALSAVQRKQGDTWSDVWTNGTTMFSDMTLDVCLRLVFEVAKDNLGPFIPGLLHSFSGEPEADQTES